MILLPSGDSFMDSGALGAETETSQVQIYDIKILDIYYTSRLFISI